MDKKFLVTGILIILAIYIPAAMLYPDYDDIVPKESRLIIIVSMDECSACTKMIKNLEKEIKENGVLVKKGRQNLTKYNVISVPTTIIFIENKEIKRYTGIFSKKDFLAFITKK